MRTPAKSIKKSRTPDSTVEKTHHQLAHTDDIIHRTAVKTKHTHMLPHGEKYPYVQEIALNERSTAVEPEKILDSEVSITAPLDAGFNRSLARMLSHVPPEQQQKVIDHIMTLIKEALPHIVVGKKRAALFIQKNGKAVPLFQVDYKGYTPHPVYRKNGSFVRHSGGIIVGKDPYYISELENAHPHIFQAHIAEVTPDQKDMPGNFERPGIFVGMKMGPMDQIADHFSNPELHEHIRKGTVRKDHVPEHLITPFIRVHRLPGKEGQ